MRIAAAALLLGLVAGAGGGARAQDAPSNAPPSFMVFFDWGKGEVRSDDAAVLDKVAEAYRGDASIRLKLSGHSDRSGSPATNRRAALRRAQTIRAELEKRGVPRNAMSVVSFGEERPLVRTEDGVREVQNRRVEIELGK